MSKNQLAKPGASTHAPGLPEGKTLGDFPVMEHAQKKKTSKPYSPEFRERAVRILLEHRGEYQSEAAALMVIADKRGRAVIKR
jgi:hypothetical protein